VSKRLYLTKEFCLITFVSTQHALRAEKILDQHQKIEFVLMPTPREISGGCGLSIKCYCFQSDIIREFLQRDEINVNGVYEYKKCKDNKVIKKIKAGQE